MQRQGYIFLFSFSLHLSASAYTGTVFPHCLHPPDVIHGVAHCPQHLLTGSGCSLVCNSGFIPTPGKDSTRCKQDGSWTVVMGCEIPLLVVSGGIIGQGKAVDSSVEVISLFPSKGCDRRMPDMPLVDGVSRALHNLIYLPTDRHILACNGVANTYKASCDVLYLKTGNGSWWHHSYPHHGSKTVMDLCGISDDCDSIYPDQYRGRYASETVTLEDRVYVLGGMVYDDEDGHKLSKSVRYLHKADGTYNPPEDRWLEKKEVMDTKRAFFCTTKVNGGVLMIGGLGRKDESCSFTHGIPDNNRPISYCTEQAFNKREKESVTRVQKSAEFSSISFNILGNRKTVITDMSTPRAGHGCTAVQGSHYTVLVAGGVQGFDAAAVATAEVFSWDSNTWTSISSMNMGRFGHAVVAVGDRVFAVGGDDRENTNMDSIEEYDVKRDKWSIVKQKLKKPRSNFGFVLVPHSIFDGCTIDKPLSE